MPSQVQTYPYNVLAERAGYFPVSGEHLYTVLHEVENPVARTLLGARLLPSVPVLTCRGFGGRAIRRRKELKSSDTTTGALVKARAHSST